ncbi:MULTISPECIES: helix-hairpin-helix domain-containing protein [unclassified Nostoc]|uniref:helix-hairpin-helix domain-containing protein n=1 Tax=unclassified Nostoc TaxID=2593658 RepID=UPI002AD2E0DD|nr:MULTISPECIES: helix-hairpin-helix domain-containing protein [unclassified Nostoc]MDZ8122752.1 helix-hairpin-helix domain-containing protein [Nostoc sp. CmiVER01]MDZ8226870.1 helix-hairpin-helix domain-containing protein [Nostoc sp. ChiVER01]
MIKVRYICLAAAAAVIVTLSSCSSTPTAENPSAPVASPATEAVSSNSHSGHASKEKININTAILSELDKFEAKLGVPALSNKIQASRPYGSPEDLVTKKVITQEQFDQIKDQVGVQEVALTGEAKDVDYMSKLGLMKGHLLVARELLDQNQPKQAEPHIGHPVEEIYVDVEDQLNERKVKEFKTTLVSLQDLVKSSPKDSKVKTNFASSVQAVDGAIAALPESQRSKPGFVLQVINELLDSANSEYGAAIANGKITAPIEYQDSRGFVFYANELYKGISSQVAQADPEAHKAIDTSFAELIKVWPSAIPPAKAVKTSSDVTKVVKTIEENSQKVVDKSNTQAQR